MSYRLLKGESEVLGKDKFISPLTKKTECVAFIQQVTSAPSTTLWIPGKKVKDAKPGEILRGTVIATFDSKKKYPSDQLGKHAAIYLSHNNESITVLDQWADQGEVKQRYIHFNRPKGTRRSNDGDTFFVVE